MAKGGDRMMISKAVRAAFSRESRRLIEEADAFLESRARRTERKA
jgi:hypothetical protein